MGTRANSTLAWMATGLLLVTAPLVANAGLDDPAWEPPPAHVTDIDAAIEPDTSVGTGFDSDPGAADSGMFGDDATIGPRLPDGGAPTPLPSDAAAAGCQCTQAANAGGPAGASTLLAVGGATLMLLRRRKRVRPHEAH